MAGAYSTNPIPFLENDPHLPETPIPPAFTETTIRPTLDAIFSQADITLDGSNVRTRAVLRLHKALL